MTPTVTASWARIEAWLAEHAPASRRLLNPPVTDADLAEAEAVVGVEFPAQVRESLRCHDGLDMWGNIFPGQPPLSAEEIAEHWTMCMEILDEGDGDEGDGEPWWHPLWIPWAQSDGDSQVVDLRPGPGYGRLGWVYHDGSGVTDSSPDLAAYLHEVAEALDGGRPVGLMHAYLLGVDGEAELWWSTAGQTEVNGSPLVPAPVRTEA